MSELDEFFSKVGTYQDERTIRVCERRIVATGFGIGKYRCSRLLAKEPSERTTPCHHCDQLLILCTCHPDAELDGRVCTKRSVCCPLRSQIE